MRTLAGTSLPVQWRAPHRLAALGESAKFSLGAFRAVYDSFMMGRERPITPRRNDFFERHRRIFAEPRDGAWQTASKCNIISL
jgi:hypothetical protein